MKISTEYGLPLDSKPKILYLSVMKTTTTTPNTKETTMKNPTKFSAVFNAAKAAKDTAIEAAKAVEAYEAAAQQVAALEARAAIATVYATYAATESAANHKASVDAVLAAAREAAATAKGIAAFRTADAALAAAQAKA